MTLCSSLGGSTLQRVMSPSGTRSLATILSIPLSPVLLWIRNTAPHPPSSIMMTSIRPVNPAKAPAPTITHSTLRIHRHNLDGLSDIAKEQNQRSTRDIEWKVVGPMPPDTFLERFLPCQTRVPQFDDATFQTFLTNRVKSWKYTLHWYVVHSFRRASLHTSPRETN